MQQCLKILIVQELDDVSAKMIERDTMTQLTAQNHNQNFGAWTATDWTA